MGPFLVASMQRKFLYVAIDYFIKWMEAELVAQIIEFKARDFVWKCIIYRFGLPRMIIIDNDKQFNNKKFKKFLVELHIKH